MKDKGLRDTLEVEKQPKESQWKGLMINSTSHKGLSPEKGIVYGMRSPNKRRGEENRKGKSEVSKEKQHEQEKPDAAFGHGHQRVHESRTQVTTGSHQL